MVHSDEERNAGKAWTRDDLEALRQMAREQVPTRAIAERLGRTEYSVRAKASHERIQLHGARQAQNVRRPR
ncbi:MAG TPA: hypothetical protein VEQ85_14065 [Lacipirellulaceae bacterium]|nr:hypothetical protein [Lacipirellulaceae bacterium]